MICSIGTTARCWRDPLLLVRRQEASDPLDDRLEVVRVRQGDDPEVVRLVPVEPGALNDVDLLLQQQVEDELLVALDRVHVQVDLREGIQCTLRLDTRDAGDGVERLPRAVALLAESSTL